MNAGAQNARTVNANGIVTRASLLSTPETTRRLLTALEQHGQTVFARVDHMANAQSVNLPLRPTEVIIFGAPQGGTHLMQENQTAGLDLPSKVLVWEDAGGKTWLSYNDPDWIAERHNLGSPSAPTVTMMVGLMDALTRAAAGG